MTDSLFDKRPNPVNLDRLRSHFREVYALTEPQIEVMLESSSRSVRQALEDVQPLLEENVSSKALKPFLHGMKGLLLNIGEVEWADRVREMERMAVENRLEEPQRAIALLETGLEEIRDYSHKE